jgi:hypothetical protein
MVPPDCRKRVRRHQETHRRGAPHPTLVQVESVHRCSGHRPSRLACKLRLEHSAPRRRPPPAQGLPPTPMYRVRVERRRQASSDPVPAVRGAVRLVLGGGDVLAAAPHAPASAEGDDPKSPSKALRASRLAGGAVPLIAVMCVERSRTARTALQHEGSAVFRRENIGEGKLNCAVRVPALCKEAVKDLRNRSLDSKDVGIPVGTGTGTGKDGGA